MSGETTDERHVNWQSVALGWGELWCENYMFLAVQVGKRAGQQSTPPAFKSSDYVWSGAAKSPTHSLTHPGSRSRSRSTNKRLRRSVLVPVLLLRLVDNLFERPRLLGGLPLLRLEGRDGRRVGDGEAPLHGRALPAARQPRLDRGELVDGDGGEVEAVDPAEQRNVGDAVLALAGAHDVVAVLEARVEDPVQPLRLADISLDGIRDFLLGKADEVVPDPRLGTGVVVVVDGKAEAALRVIPARQVSEDGVALEHGEAAVVVVHNGGDAAVGVHGREPRLLLHVLANVDALRRVLQAVRLLELLEQDAGLVAVWRACQELDALGGDEAGRTRHGGDGVFLFGRRGGAAGTLVCVTYVYAMN
ncbi:hypothetical protein VFPFJ_04071 [Purpureocillium lilacinum]|uniref:Uncharacterized protein n=1 Tax=Purpureocillium lilacinum TaxID=33203 RepID=A0A179HRZ9_PURLI|nr:hypothetical protein VFPFJ_04071 [Purpureocillium lilacinum]OAQ92331.1 hypothetical protein VFPFJ_04071 [Purpureocillium lilacinum]